jgi:hypothetical protein
MYAIILKAKEGETGDSRPVATQHKGFLVNVSAKVENDEQDYQETHSGPWMVNSNSSRHSSQGSEAFQEVGPKCWAEG